MESTLVAWSAALLVIGVHPRVLAFIANLLLRFILLQNRNCGRRRGFGDAGNVAATEGDPVAVSSATIQQVSFWGLAMGGIMVQTTDGLMIRIRTISLRLRQGSAKAGSRSCVKKSGVKMPVVVLGVDGVRISVSTSHGRLTPYIFSSERAAEIANTAGEQHVHGTNERRAAINGLSLPRLAVWSAHVVGLEINDLRIEEVTGPICARQTGSILGGDTLSIDAQREPSENARMRTMDITGLRVQGSYSRHVQCLSASILIREFRVTDCTGDETKRCEAGGSSPNVIQAPECSTARGRACIALDTVHLALTTIFSRPIRKRTLQLQATESLKVTLSRVDVAVDVSWLEHARATSRRREDSRVQNQISFLRQMQREPESNIGNNHKHKEGATEPSTEHGTDVGIAGEGYSPLLYRAQRSATTLSGSLFDSRFVPARAMLALGTFKITSVDDVGKTNPLASGCDPCPLGKLEICGRGREVLGLASTGEGSDAAGAGGDLHNLGNSRNSFTFSWAITTGGGSSSLSNKIKVAMARITTTNANEYIGEALTGAQASAFLSEIRFSCCSEGPVDDAKATAAFCSKRRSVTEPTQAPGLVISAISFVPTFDVQRFPSIAQKCPEKVLPISSLSTEATESASITIEKVARGCFFSERSRVSTPGRMSPPPLPPRPRVSDPKFCLKVPEVKFQMEAVRGSVGVDMAAWLSLRGCWDTQDLTAATQRAENLFAVEGATSATSRASQPRLCGTIMTVRVTVEEVLKIVGETRRCSALFEIEVDDMRVQKNDAIDGKERIPESCNRLFRAEKSRSLTDAAVRDTAVSVECCRASLAFVDDISVAFPNAEDSTECQFILDARGIKLTKVTEKGPLGTTTRSAVEVLCEQVLGEERIGDQYRASVATLEGLSFAQLSLADSCTLEDKLNVGGNANEKPRHTEKETLLMTKEVTSGDVASASTASRIPQHTRLTPPPAAARGSGVKLQETKVEQTDMAWSGSCHCWFILWSRRFAHTVNYLVGLPPVTLPREFTKRVLLQRAYIRCALGEVDEGGRGEPRLSLGSLAKENNSSKGFPRWCGHRMDVRLRNFETCSETKKLAVPTDNQEQRKAGDSRCPGIQTELTVTSSLLEILIPSSSPAPAQAQRPSSIPFYCCHNRRDTTGDGVAAPSGTGRRRHTLPRRSATVKTDKGARAAAGALGGTREELEETILVTSDWEEEGEEGTPDSRIDKPSHYYCGPGTTKVMAVESFKYRRSVQSSPQERQSFSSDARRCNDGGDDESSRLGRRRESSSNIPGWPSHMSISFRAEGAAVTIPPRFQLGDLLMAVHMQRKGIEAVLGGAPTPKSADSCATSIVLGSFHLRVERDHPIPPPSVPCTPHPARPSSLLTPRLHQHTIAMSVRSSGSGHGSDVVPPSRATSSDGQSGGGGRGDTGGGADDTPSIPRTFLRGIKRRGASLSALLGLGGSGSGSGSGSDSSENARGEEGDKDYGDESCRDGTPVPGGEGSFNATSSKTMGGGADGGSDCSVSPPLAVLETGQTSFEVSRKEPRQTLLAAVRQLDEHPGDVTYGHAMGGWGKLSTSSSALFLDNLPVPFLSAESVVCEGLFASAALTGVDTSFRQVFSRLSSSHAEHPLARAAAAAEATETAGGLSCAASSSLKPNSFDGVPGGHPAVRPPISSLSRQQQLPEQSGTVLLLLGVPTGGDEEHLQAGGAAMRRYARFVERTDGTQTKIYVDLNGGVAGLRMVYGKCLDSSVEKLLRVMSRLFPATTAVNKQPAKQEEQQRISSTRSQLFRMDSAGRKFGFSGSANTDPVAETIHAATPNTPPAAKAAAAPFVGFWDRLRRLLHGKVSFTAEELELTTLLGSSPALVAASVRLLVANAKVAYHLGHVDLRIQRMLVTTPARPVATVSESGNIHAGNYGEASSSPPKETGAAGEFRLGTINPHASAPHLLSYPSSWLEEHQKTHSISTEVMGGSTVGAGSHKSLLKLAENLFGPRHSVAFLAETALSIDFIWTCKNGADPNLHHLETTPAGSHDARADDDAWFSYRATGLKLRVTAEISRHVSTAVADVTAASNGGIDSSTGDEGELRAATGKQGGGEQGGTRRYRCIGSQGLEDRWGLGRESTIDVGVGVGGGEGEDGGESAKGHDSLVGKVLRKSRATRAGTSINNGKCGEARGGEKLERFAEEGVFRLRRTNGSIESYCRGVEGGRSTDDDVSKALHLAAAKIQDDSVADERSRGPTTMDPSFGRRTTGTSSCLPKPACKVGSVTETFVAEDDQREESIRLFGQGLWVAIRLDLLEWFKTLLAARTPTGSHSSKDQSTVNDAGVKCARTTTTVGGEDHTGGGGRASSGTNSGTVSRTIQDLGSDPGSGRASLKSLVTGVEFSVTVSGFGLATWRSAVNRDGFVFNINRIRTSLFVGDKFAPFTGGANGVTNVGRKSVNVSLETIRLFRLHVARDTSLSFGGGETLPKPPPAGWRRKSRPTVFGRQSAGDISNTPSSPPAPNPVETQGRQDENTDLIVSLDRSLSAASDEIAFLRARELTFRIKDAGVDSDVKSRSGRSAPSPPIHNNGREGRSTGHTQVPVENLAKATAAAPTSVATGVLTCASSSSHNGLSPPPTEALCDESRRERVDNGEAGENISGGNPVSHDDDADVRKGEGAAHSRGEPTLLPCTYIAAARPRLAKTGHPRPWRTTVAERVASQPRLADIVVRDDRFRPKATPPQAIAMISTGVPVGVDGSDVASVGKSRWSSGESRALRSKTPPPLPPRPRPPQLVCEGTRASSEISSASVTPEVERNVPATTRAPPFRDSADGCAGGTGATILIFVDGLHLMWTLEIRDGVFLFVADARDSFSRTISSDDKDTSPPAAGGNDGSDRCHPHARCESDSRPGDDCLASTEHLGSVGRASQPARSPSRPVVEDSTARGAEALQSAGGVAASGGITVQGVMAREDKHTSVKSGEAPSQSPSAHEQRPPQSLSHPSPASSDMNFTTSPRARGVCSTLGCRGDGSSDQGSLLDWLRNRSGQAKSILSDGTSSSGVPSPDSLSKLSPLHPRGRTALSNAQPAKPVARSSPRSGAVDSKRAAANSGGRAEPCGGGNRVDYEVRFDSPQIKLVGEGSSLVLYADGAHAEARTYATCLAVASTPGSPRASLFRKGYYSLLRRKEVKVQLKGARVFAAAENDGDRDRWVKNPAKQSVPTPANSPGRSSGTSASGTATIPTSPAPSKHTFDSPSKSFGSSGKSAGNQGETSSTPASPLTSPRSRPPYPSGIPVRKDEEEGESNVRRRTRRRRFGRTEGGGDSGGGGSGSGGGIRPSTNSLANELKEVMKPFCVHALYVYHEVLPACESEARLRRALEISRRDPVGTSENFGVRRCLRPPSSKLRLDVPVLNTNLDSRQFFEVLDVVKNLLLAPPPTELRSWVLERKLRRRVEGCIDSKEVLGQEAIKRENKSKDHDVRNKHDREHLREIVEKVLSSWDSGGNASSVPPSAPPATIPPRAGGGGRSPLPAEPRELTRIEYRIGRCTWLMTLDQEVNGLPAQVEVGVTGLSSTNNYLGHRRFGPGVVVQNVRMQIERLWARHVPRPGDEKQRQQQQRQECSDSSVAPLAHRNDDSSWSILSPRLCGTQPCQSCGEHFAPEHNAWNSCRVHGTDEGEVGEFVVLAGHATSSCTKTSPKAAAALGRVGRWSCCGAGSKSAPGCVSRPHVPKEIMITVRADGAPPVLVGTTKVSCFRHFEVNIFPAVLYELELYLRRGVAASIMRYFKIEPTKNSEDALPRGPRLIAPSSRRKSRSDSHGACREPPPRSRAGPAAALAGHGMTGHYRSGSDGACTLLLGKRGSGAAAASAKAAAAAAVAAAAEVLPAPTETTSGGADPPSKESSDEDAAGDTPLGQDAVYLKYVRLGEIKLNVNASGLKIMRFRNLKVSTPPYVRHKKMSEWSRLSSKIAWHLGGHVMICVFKQLHVQLGMLAGLPVGDAGGGDLTASDPRESRRTHHPRVRSWSKTTGGGSEGRGSSCSDESSTSS